jgi:uncharacterized protein
LPLRPDQRALRAFRSAAYAVGARLLVTAVIAAIGFGGGSLDARNFFEGRAEQDLANAIAKGDESRIAYLQSLGTSVAAQGKEGMTFIYWAVLNRSKHGLMYLLSHGANPNVTFDPKGTRFAGFPDILEGSSPISVAAKLEDPWFLRQLAEHGGDINLVNPISGQSPLMEALASNRRENVHYLVSRGAELDTVDNIGFTPLAAAIGNQKFDIAYELLVAGADPTIPIARNGATILAILRHTPIPDPPQSDWREKVIDLLEKRGLDVVNGK